MTSIAWGIGVGAIWGICNFIRACFDRTDYDLNDDDGLPAWDD